MVELLQLIEAGLTVTAVTIAAVTYPAALLTGSDPPDISPLVETISEKDLYSTQQKTP